MVNTSRLEARLLKRIQRAMASASTDDERARILENAETRFPELKDAVALFGMRMVDSRKKVVAAKQILKLLDDKNTGRSDFAALEPVEGLTVLTLCTLLDMDSVKRARKIMSDHGTHASVVQSLLKAATSHAILVTLARKLIANGTPPHNLAGKIKRRTGVSLPTIRTALHEVGILKKKMKMK